MGGYTTQMTGRLETLLLPQGPGASAPSSLPQERVSGLTGAQRLFWCLGLLSAFAVWRAGAGGASWFRVAEASAPAAESLAADHLVGRPFYGRRLEPREPMVLHGGGPLEEASFVDYSRALGVNGPMLTSSSVDLHDDLPGFFARLRRELDRDQQHSGQNLLVPEIGLSLNAGEGSRSVEAGVGSGEEDARLIQLVAGLRQLDRPVFLRVGYAFNDASSHSEPRSYVAAFRRIATTLRAAGLEQVALVWEWSPDAELDAEEAGARERDAAERWLAFYPGDDVVDWWGLSLFSEPGISSPVTAQFLAAADRHRFPVMIGESTPRGHETGEGALVVDGWYRPYFQLIAKSPVVKAFTYLDRDWQAYPQWSSWGDARVEADPTVLRYTQAELSRPLYAGLRSREQTEALLGLR